MYGQQQTIIFFLFSCLFFRDLIINLTQYNVLVFMLFLSEEDSALTFCLADIYFNQN